MNRDNLTSFRKWFYDYVAAYYTDDHVSNRNINLKEKHTGNVCREIIMLGRALGLPPQDMLLAEAMALFHDIGRFPQYAVYRTFNDSSSENHAELGLKELDRHQVLSACSNAEQTLITKAIRYHNVCTLPEDEDERCLFFTRLLRDADKLDIWKVVIDYYDHRDEQPNSTIELGLPDNQACSPAILNALRDHKIAVFKDMTTLNDFKLLQLSWIFDVNFSPTFRAVYERQYMEKIAATLPQTAEISGTLKIVQAYIKEQDLRPTL